MFLQQLLMLSHSVPMHYFSLLLVLCSLWSAVYLVVITDQCPQIPRVLVQNGSYFTWIHLINLQAMIILEFMSNGDLRDYLIKNRPRYS